MMPPIIRRKSNHPRTAYPLAESIMNRRPAANMVIAQGIDYVEGRVYQGNFCTFEKDSNKVDTFPMNVEKSML